jgi:hypothetical protein
VGRSCRPVYPAADNWAWCGSSTAALEMTVAQLHAHQNIVLGVNVSGTTAGDYPG